MQIHNLKLVRQRVIEDQKPVPEPKIATGDLVLVKDHTSKSFMPKYKTDFRVIRILGNKVEVKDNSHSHCLICTTTVNSHCFCLCLSHFSVETWL